MKYNESRPEDIPAENEDSEGKDDPCCAVGHSVDGAEGEPHPALTRCHGVGHEHCRDRLDIKKTIFAFSGSLKWLPFD